MLFRSKTILIVFKKTGASITETGIQDELKELQQNYNNSLEESTKKEKIICTERIV